MLRNKSFITAIEPIFLFLSKMHEPFIFLEIICYVWALTEYNFAKFDNAV